MTETVLEYRRQPPTAAIKRNPSECPYPGPRPYKYGEESQFRGRSSDIEHLKSLLLAERIVFLHGPSGTGKSSLVRAGLVPQLGHFEMAEVTLRHPLPRLYAEESINPFVYSLAISIETALSMQTNKSANVDSMDTSALKALMQLPPASYLQRRLRNASEGKHLLLVFDQFEELFTASEHDDAVRREFLVELRDLLVDSEIWALFVLRDEYMPQLLGFRQYVPSHVDNTYSLGYLDHNAARAAICEPALDWGGLVEEDVVNKLVKGLALRRDTNVASVRIDPLHLQLVCMRLWKNRKRDDGCSSGSESAPSDVSGDNKQHASPGAHGTRHWLIDMQVLDSVALKKQDAQLEQRVVDAALIAYIDDTLIAVAESAQRQEYKIRMSLEDTFIREGRYRERVEEPNESDSRLAVFRSLEKKSILRLDPKIDSTWYELSHDRLVAPFQESNRQWFATRGNVAEFVRLARDYCHAGRPMNFKTLPKRQWLLPESPAENDDPLVRPSPCEQEYRHFCEQKARRKQRMMVGSIVLLIVLGTFLGVGAWSLFLANRVFVLTDRQEVDNLVAQALNNRWRRHNHDIALVEGLEAHRINASIEDRTERKPDLDILNVLHSVLSAAPFSGTVSSDGDLGVTAVRLLSKFGGSVVAFENVNSKGGIFLIGTMGARVEPFADAQADAFGDCRLVPERRFWGVGDGKIALIDKGIRLIDLTGCRELFTLKPPAGTSFDSSGEHWASEDGGLIGALLSDGSIAFYNLGPEGAEQDPRVFTTEDLVGEGLMPGERITVVAGNKSGVAIGDDEGNIGIIEDLTRKPARIRVVNPLMQPEWPGIAYDRLENSGHWGARAIAALRLEPSKDGGLKLWVGYKGGKTTTNGGRLFMVEGLDADPRISEVLPDASSRALWRDSATKGHGSIKASGEPVTTASFESVEGDLYFASAGAEGTVRLWDLSRAAVASRIDDSYLGEMYGIPRDQSGELAQIRRQVSVVPVQELPGLVAGPHQMLLSSEGSVPVVYAITDRGNIRYWRNSRNPYAYSNVYWAPDEPGGSIDAFLYDLGFDSRGGLLTTNNRGQVGYWVLSNESDGLTAKREGHMIDDRKVVEDGMLPASIRSLDLAADWGVIGLGGDNSVRILSLGNRLQGQAKEVLRLDGHSDGVWETLFRPANEDFELAYDVVSADWQGKVMFWNVQRNENDKTRPLERHGERADLDLGAWVPGMAFHKDGRYLLAATKRPSLSLIDLEGGCDKREAATPSSKRKGEPCILWTVADDAYLDFLPGIDGTHDDLTPIHAVAFRPDGKAFAAVGESGMVLELPFDEDAAHRPPASAVLTKGFRRGHRGTVKGVAYVPAKRGSVDDTGFFLVTAGRDGRVGVWPSPTKSDSESQARPMFLTSDDGAALMSLAVSADGEYIAAGSRGRRFRIWSLDALEQARRTVGEQNL